MCGPIFILVELRSTVKMKEIFYWHQIQSSGLGLVGIENAHILPSKNIVRTGGIYLGPIA